VSNKTRLNPRPAFSPSLLIWTLGGGLFLAILLVFILKPESLTVADCNFTYPGDTGSLSLNPGDSVCIPGDRTFTGSVSSFPAGSKITIEAGASFRPTSMPVSGGRLLNRGEAIMPGIVLDSGFTLINEDTISFEGSFAVDGPTQIFNAEQGRITLAFPFDLDEGALLNNEGIIYTGSDWNLGDGSEMTNNGYFFGAGSSILDGTIDNYGLFSCQGSIRLGANAQVNNQCTFISAASFTNDAPNTLNAGIILVEGGGGFPNDLVEINQPLENGSQGYIAGIRFINNSTISGGGNFYFSGETENNGSFGTDGNGINFYDASSPVNLMDIENVVPDPSVTRDISTIPDSFYVPGGCDVSFFPSFLPVEWEDLSVSLQGDEALIRWSTRQEVNHDRFEVERSLSGRDFTYLGTVVEAHESSGAVKSYRFVDKHADEEARKELYYRIKQIDIDGRTSYSRVLSLSMAPSERELEVRIPNPVRGQRLSLGLTASRSGEGEFMLRDVQGRIILRESMQVLRGSSSRYIGIGPLPGGIYIAEVKFGASSYKQKILIYSE